MQKIISLMALALVAPVVALANAPIREQPKDPPKQIVNSIGMKFVWIPPGSFMMGSPANEARRGKDEIQHKVTLTKGFYMGVYAVTQEEWQAVMGKNPSFFKGEKNLPVERISWDHCQDFVKKMRDKDKKSYRLPTEAEWEYACRAGTTTPYHFGANITSDQANYLGEIILPFGKKGVFRKKTTPVGGFPANAWGLHDMHGNVWQRCQDWYGEYPPKDVVDPQGPNTGTDRVMRGGAWGVTPDYLRSGCRYKLVPTWGDDAIGLRVCFSLE
jgi:formylglycine-generating enzyme required for sulfatase activity